MKNLLNNIDQDLILTPYRQGIQLTRPASINKLGPQQTRLAQVLDLPINIYFLDVNSVILKMNDTCAKVSEAASTNDLIGKTVFDISPFENAKQITDTDYQVVRQNTCRISEENMLLIKQGLDKNCLSFKMPWYDQENKIVGVFGYSIYFEIHPLAESLSKIANLGLLKPFGNINTQFFSNEFYHREIYFSKRERECIHYLLRGKSAKGIARILNLSARTIEFYTRNIKKKLGATTRAELIDKLIDDLI